MRRWLRDGDWAEWLAAVLAAAFMAWMVVALLGAVEQCEAGGGEWRAKPPGCIEAER